MNAAHARGAVTTRDRAWHMIAAQLEADFCLPHGSVAKAHGQGGQGYSRSGSWPNPRLVGICLNQPARYAGRLNETEILVRRTRYVVRMG